PCLRMLLFASGRMSLEGAGSMAAASSPRRSSCGCGASFEGLEGIDMFLLGAVPKGTLLLDERATTGMLGASPLNGDGATLFCEVGGRVVARLPLTGWLSEAPALPVPAMNASRALASWIVG